MSDNLTALDSDLASSAKFRTGGGFTVNFQFPPKILNDSRTGSWIETEVPGDQPIAVWKTSGARKWVLEWTYVVGAGKEWDVEKVRSQVVGLRDYWTYNGNQASSLIVFFSIWGLGGSGEMTCRLTNVDISHGKAIYAGGAVAYPVITNVKVSMQLWTKGGDSAGAGKLKMDVPALADFVPADWQ
jgi:hypothetical protein